MALWVALAVVAATGTACEDREPPAANGTPPPSFHLATITTDAGDTFRWVRSGDAVTVSAPRTNTGFNTRVALLADDARPVRDGEACETWDGPDFHSIQPGVVLRVNTTDGHTTGIMVSNNIYGFNRRVLNVHLIDTRAAHPFDLVAGRQVSTIGPADDRLRPLPWRLCAQVVGSTVRAKLWATVDPEPAWDGPTSRIATVDLPAGAPTRGRGGAYLGHVEAGETTTVSNLTTAALKHGL